MESLLTAEDNSTSNHLMITSTTLSRDRSTKGETISRLEDSAVELFGSYGFEGTSLRDIAARARRPLSTIDRHFGSKLALFNAVHQHVWKQIDAERQALMRNPIAVNGDGLPTLEAILYAFIHPLVLRAEGNEKCATSVRLLREMMSMKPQIGGASYRKPIKGVADRWIMAIMAACPALPRSNAVWVYSFVVGVSFCGQLVDGCLDELMPARNVQSPDEITMMLVSFCSAGVRGVIDGTEAPATLVRS